MKFDSKLEKDFYDELTKRKIEFTLHPDQITIHEPFISLTGRKYQASRYTIDFVIDNFMIEIKGFKRGTDAYKYKDIDRYYTKQGKYFYMVQRDALKYGGRWYTDQQLKKIKEQRNKGTLKKELIEKDFFWLIEVINNERSKR